MVDTVLLRRGTEADYEIWTRFSGISDGSSVLLD